MQLLFTAGLPNGFLQAVCQTLIHSLWQGLITAVLAALIVTFTKRSAAAVRYNLLTGVLFLFVLSIGITAGLQLKSKTGASETAVVNHVAISSYLPASIDTDNGFLSNAKEDFIGGFTRCCNEHAAMIVMVWFFLFLIKCVQLVTGLRYIQRLRNCNNYEANAYWKEQLLELAKKTGIRRSILFLESELVKVPAAIGFLKPVLLVPAGLLAHLPPEQVEAILLHELAHIHRKDFLVNVLQSFVETFFFFNPAITWLSSLIREEREACCDDIVLRHIPQKANYLQALVSFQEVPLQSKSGAMALNGNQHYLLNRVRRMLTLENKKLNLMEKTVLLLSIIGFTAFGFITNKISASTDPVVSLEKNIPTLLTTKTEKTAPVHFIKEPGVKKKKALNPSVFKSVADTVPKPPAKRSFPKISSNTNSEGKNLVSEIEATDNEGTTYRIKRVDGQPTELWVNGKAIPQSQYGDYDEVLRQIDQTQRQGSLRWKVGVQPKKADAAVKRKEAIQQKTAAGKMDQLLIERKLENDLAKQIHLQKMEDRKWVLQRNQNKMEYNQLKAGTLQKEIARSYKASESMQKARVQFQQKKSAPLKPDSLFWYQVKLKDNNDVIRILSDLNRHKLIADANNFSFSLNDTELIVNGTKQSSELHQEFKKKYIQKNSDRFQYSKKGNATSININKE